jgi:hypothetical protein
MKATPDTFTLLNPWLRCAPSGKKLPEYAPHLLFGQIRTEKYPSQPHYTNFRPEEKLRQESFLV